MGRGRFVSRGSARRGSGGQRWLPLAVAALAACGTSAALAVAAIVGWRFGAGHTPDSFGCGCFNPMRAGATLLFGALGSLAAVTLVAVGASVLGLAAYALHRRAGTTFD